MFRATAPSDTSMNLTLWALFIVLPAVLAVGFAHFFNEMSLWVAGLAGAATGAATAGAAALLDKANERLAIIPLSWGTVAVVIVWFKSEHQS